ncbi:hypothetical protein C4573_00770 [Candidatus Woesearchaeota archaeon]|nr:MAG: hypothetical protein C4573_00770 [Candidatus Woesearchaeota archaeon]
MQHHEHFRPVLEKHIHDGTLETYMEERLSGKTENPPLAHRFGDETPEQIFLYFTGFIVTAPGKTYYPQQIFATARNLLKQLEEDSEKAKAQDYGSGLAMLLQWTRNEEQPSILAAERTDTCRLALDLLLKKGMPNVSEAYFAEDVERSLINLFGFTYYQGILPQDRIKTVSDMLSQYVRIPQFSSHGEVALLKVDYATGLQMLPTAIDNTAAHQDFTIAFYLVHQEDPAKLAEDLVKTLDEKHLDFFLRALEFQYSKPGYNDNIQEAFLKEVRKQQTTKTPE